MRYILFSTIHCFMSTKINEHSLNCNKISSPHLHTAACSFRCNVTPHSLQAVCLQHSDPDEEKIMDQTLNIM